MNARPLVPTLLKGLIAAAVMACSWAAQAQSSPVCGAEIKADISKQLSLSRTQSEQQQLELQAKLYEQFSFCAEDSKNVSADDPFFTAAKQCGASVTYNGSTYYEEMPCCGYDPQRRSFACPVKVKQTFGFGSTPNPGSREYTLHCVADQAGVFLPVGQDNVHLSNAIAGSRPTWQFGVITNAVDNLQNLQPMNGATRTVRSILSWNLKPTGCDYKPIWGNVIEYRVRTDQ
jgi:hypothetical protein